MYQFRLETELRLLTAVRTGEWSLELVRSYETALRHELSKLHLKGPPTAFIIDIRASGSQPKAVAEALRRMVERLGPLRAQKAAIVTSSGFGKLQAKLMGDPNAQVFTSMILARDWVLSRADEAVAGVVHNEPSNAAPQGATVHIVGPADVDVTLTPKAALETAKRIGDAAMEVLVSATTPSRVLRDH